MGRRGPGAGSRRDGAPVGGAFGRLAGNSFRTPGGRGPQGGPGAPTGGPRSTPNNRPGSNSPQNRPGNDRSNAKPNDTKSTTRDPIDVVSGEVLLSQVDATMSGELPLVLGRTHISGYRAGQWFGRSWASALDQCLVLDAEHVR